ncbi:MAG TPA: AraC family transcriptional regulator [Rhizomicrobium sp.]
MPESERLPFFREFLGRQVMRQDIDPLPDHRFRTDTTMRRLPGLLMYWTTGTTTSSARQIRRTRQLLSDGNDSLLIQWVSTARHVEHLGREVFVGPGEGIMFSCADTRSVLHPSDYRTLSLSVPRSALGPRLRDIDSALCRPLHAGSAAQRLLFRYLELLRDESSADATELRDLVTGHVYDLLAVALGATRDAAETAGTRGVRAARLAEIKDSVRQNLPRVTLSEITVRHRLTPRYVQILFEEDGTTFTEFVLEQRLVLARRLLAGPGSTGRKITDIALSCGFGDVSYFNRKFRGRFGSTPSDMRNRGGVPGTGAPANLP